MKKKLLAALISVIIVMSAFACVCSVSAGVAGFDVADIEDAIKVCPGTALPLEAPAVIEYSEAFSQGWEIKYSEGGDWMPYDGSAFPEDADPGISQVVWVRYFVTDVTGMEKETSNVCEVTVAHTPQGGFEKNALEHWRVCAECDGKCDMEPHTSLTDGGANGETCTVCGGQRSYHFSFFFNFLNWIMGIIQSFL